ncbi:hypothetical protein [Sphingomonas sp. PAMC 26621]|uniref:hypothetical protein n=1 Tax=Sphingomonas sp. PAMC 26621 TaxID=1112213 RepID=UPI00028843D8|nr:hypothetical protein [Sphingomonas sp. PAMC 26621]
MTDQTYREGQKARLKSGETVVMKGGQWVSTSPQGAAPSDAVLQRQAAAVLSKEQPAVDLAHRSLEALDEFDGINNRLHPRGGFLNHVANTVSGWLGDKDLARIDQLSKNFALHQRQPGSGSSSDFDQRMYNGMVASADQPYQTNVDFSRTARSQANDIIARHQFRDQYLRQNGTLVGSDAAYAQRRKPAPPSTRAKPVASGWTVEEIK